jgi:polar amino acid transport system substrate-binding protein
MIKWKVMRRRAAYLGLCVLMLTACSGLPQLDLSEIIVRAAATPVVVIEDTDATPVPATLSTAALVKRRSAVRIGIRYDAPPLARVNEAGELEGMDVDLAREFARRWLGSERNAEFVQVTTATAAERVARREVDLALGGLTIQRSAERTVDFSIAYLGDGEAILTRVGEFTDFRSLARRRVTYIDFATVVALGDIQAATNLTVALQARNTYQAAIGDLLDGATDGVAGRLRRLRVAVAENSALSIPIMLTSEPVAIMLPPDDSAWADLVNLTLAAMMADGTFRRLHERWFGTAPEPLEVIPQPLPPSLASLPNTRAPKNTLSDIRAAQGIRVGFDPQAAPFSALNDAGQPTGYEVALVREMARRWFGNPGRAQFLPLTADQIADALAGGTVQLAVGGIPRTGQNEQRLDFALTTFSSAGVPLAIALPANDSGLRDLVNFTLQDMLADGTLGRIFQRWFPDQPLPAIPRWLGSEPGAAALLTGES